MNNGLTFSKFPAFSIDVTVRIGSAESPSYYPMDGISLSKKIVIEPQSFSSLVELLKRFDDLCDAITAEHPDLRLKFKDAGEPQP